VALRLLERADSFQRRHRAVAIPLAVQRKYSADEGGNLAASTAYYGFFSLFPLLLVFVTVLGYVLGSHPHLEERIVGSTLGRFPVIGPQLQVHALHGSGFALAIGLIGALWAGTAVTLTVESAFDRFWDVPPRGRLGFAKSRLRALLALLVFGGAVILSTVGAGIGSYGGSYGFGFKLLGIVLSFAVDFGVFWVAFRVLTAADVSWRDVRPGAAAAALFWVLLQALGGLYVSHVLASSSNTYGTFALVIGLLSWIYLCAHVTLLCAEANVVLARGLWPQELSSADAPAAEREQRSAGRTLGA